MLDLIAFLTLSTSIATYILALRAGVYWRIPVVHYAMMGGASCLALYSVFSSGTWFSIVVLSLCILSLAGLVWYVHFEAPFRRSRIRLELGQRFPGFTLPDSGGGVFDSSAMVGKHSALYLFYRGHW